MIVLDTIQKNHELYIMMTMMMMMVVMVMMIMMMMMMMAMMMMMMMMMMMTGLQKLCVAAFDSNKYITKTTCSYDDENGDHDDDE